MMAPASRPSRMTSLAYRRRAGSANVTTSSVSTVDSPIAARSMPAAFRRVTGGTGRYRAAGPVPVTRSATTCACAHAGATSPDTSPGYSAQSPIA